MQSVEEVLASIRNLMQREAAAHNGRGPQLSAVERLVLREIDRVDSAAAEEEAAAFTPANTTTAPEAGPEAEPETAAKDDTAEAVEVDDPLILDPPFDMRPTDTEPADAEEEEPLILDADIEEPAAEKIPPEDIFREGLEAMRATPADAPSSEPDVATIDEAALEALVRELVRGELQSAFGDEVTRRIRKMIQREVRLALGVHMSE
ncbi:MAG: hypothetical protein AAGE18_03320 [Pseudomonadota bacterium]